MAKRLLRQMLGLDGNDESDNDDLQLASAAVAVHELCRTQKRPRHGGSVMGRVPILRNTMQGHTCIFNDYFAPNSVYNDDHFRRRFRMTKLLFCRILEAVTAHDEYFTQRYNAAQQLGCSPLQKVTAALRMLAYGCSADSLDEDVRMGESTIIASLKHFVRSVVAVFGPHYLRRPTEVDIARILPVAEKRGFPGMLGSIDCMHWVWEKCPYAWQGYFKGHCHKPTMVLEAVAGPDLWIWHAFFGMPGSLNDINVLHRSPVFDDIATGNAPNVNFEVNGRPYDMGYFLGDGIYPDWATLVKGIRHPLSRKQSLFTKKQCEFRKDVERAFGVLQAKFQICKGPSRSWKPKDIKSIMDVVVVMHNMVVEDERHMEALGIYDYHQSTPPSYIASKNVPTIHQMMSKLDEIESREGHAQLQSDLIEHVWVKFGKE